MSKHKRIELKAPLGGSTSSLNVTAPLRYLDQKIRFSLRDCDRDKFCIRKLGDGEIDKFYQRLGHFEELTWRQIRQIPLEKGFSIEKKETSNFKIFYSSYPNYSTFLHFRVYGLPNVFRVFGALKEDLCCLLSIDKEGSINH